MFDLTSISARLPSVSSPLQKLNFRDKAKWTLIILALYFILGSIVIWGIQPSAVAQFEFLEIVFGSKFGSLITLGIGPIVTASIILQLLIGSKIINWDLKKEEEKRKFMGVQKILAILFCFIEAAAYVIAGAIPPSLPALAPFVILQLAAGGIIILFMDEVCSKWGFGSGISLFIAAGVSKTIFIRIFAPPLKEAGGGIISVFISSLAQGQPATAFLYLLPLIAMLVVFFIVVFAQDMRIEIPMSFAMPFGKFAARRWPLKFIYTSNIPVILTAAVIANMQVVGRLLFQKGIKFLGEYDLTTGNPTSGFMYFISNPSSASLMIVSVLGGVLALAFALLAIKVWKKNAIKFAVLGAVIGIAIGFFLTTTAGSTMPAITSADIARAIVYMSVMIIGSTIFSIFWVNTAGMDAHSVAEQFKSSSIVIPGFRHDPRIVEKVLNKYIPALTVLGGAFVGFLAGFADLTSAIGTGTGILLTVMIVYQFYEQIASQHMEDMHPALRKFMGG